MSLTIFRSVKQTEVHSISQVPRFDTLTPPCGHLPEMQVQYSSARRSNSKVKVTLDGSGQAICTSGVTFDPVQRPDLVGVQASREDGGGEPTCWARLVLKTRNSSLWKSKDNQRYEKKKDAAVAAKTVLNNFNNQQGHNQIR